VLGYFLDSAAARQSELKHPLQHWFTRCCQAADSHNQQIYTHYTKRFACLVSPTLL
jgi:hypothetical protein